MESQNQIILNQKRYFGDVIGDGIKFFRINIGVLTRAFFTFIFPIFVIPILLGFGLGSADMLRDIMVTEPSDLRNETVSTMFVVAYIAFYMLMLFTYVVLALIVQSTALAYEENGNQPASYEQVKSLMAEYFANVTTSYVSLFFVFVLCLAIFIGVFIGLVSLGGTAGMVTGMLLSFVIMIIMMWFMVKLTFVPYTHMREDVSIDGAFRRSMRLVKNNWWSTFGVLFIAGVIAGIAGMIFTLPLQILIVGANFSALGSGGDSDVNLVLLGVLFLVSQLGSLYLYQYVMTCTVLKYYDLVEKADGSSLANEIGQLGENDSSFFENEGEY